jgi:hypothetical protein
MWSCACLLIVAAFESHPDAARAVSQDIPVPGGVAALAHSLAIDPVPDRGRFLSETTRLLYEAAELRDPAARTFLQAVRQSSKRGVPMAIQSAGSPPAASDLVPVPLSADIWSDAIFRRRVSRDDLVLTILADRQASLLCHGLAELDDDTLEFFANHPNLLSRLYERSAPIFAAFAGSVRVRENRVVPPGDADAALLWEAVTAEHVTRAERFLLTLFEANDGRLAYLYDTVGRLDPARRAFVLGAWMPNASMRLDRFRALATAGLNGLRDWHARTLPFSRSSYDLGMALMRLEVAPNGELAPPAARTIWSRVFGGAEIADESPVDAAWIAENVLATDVRQRGERIDQMSFAQRVFAAFEGDPSDLVLVLRSFPRFRALMLTFERAGITNVGIYANVVRDAAKLARLDGRAGYIAQAQLQGSLVLLTRMVSAGTLDARRMEYLLDRLIGAANAVPAVDPTLGGVTTSPAPLAAPGPGAVARWLRDDLHPVLPRARDLESAVIAGLAGPAAGASAAPRVTWEGQLYKLDLSETERSRLQRVREKQRSPRLDVPIEMADAGRLLSAERVTVDDVQDIAAELAALATDLPQRSRDEEADSVPSGVSPPVPYQEVLRKAADELTRAARNKDIKRARRVADPIIEIADDLLARNLLSFAYAISVGDPDGTVLLADDVSQRHDFGFGLKDTEARGRVTWALPHQEIAPGVPWHVSGSLLGLDAALSTLALRRISTDRVLEAPKLTTSARDTFAASVSLMDPLALRDADRDEIAAAIERGRSRVLEATDVSKLNALAAELAIDGARARALGWTLTHEPERLLAMLSLTELLALGGGRTDSLHPWGMAVIATNGCLCSRLLPPGAWPTLSGRPQLGLAPSVLPDLNFRIAILLKDLGLPAPLAKVVLSAAVQDFIDEARPTDDGDWLSLSRAARAVTRERIEDYVAAATATGPLLPDASRSPDQAR